MTPEHRPDSSYGWTLALCWAGILYMSYRCWDMLAHPGPTDGWLGMTMATVAGGAGWEGGLIFLPAQVAIHRLLALHVNKHLF